MEFYLIKDQIVRFEQNSRNANFLKRTCQPIPVTLGSVSQDFKDFKKYCKMIGKSLIDVNSKTEAGSGEDEGFQLDGNLEVSLSIPFSTSSYFGKIYVVISDGQEGVSVFEKLVGIYGAENLSFTLMIKDFMYEYVNRYENGVGLEARGHGDASVKKGTYIFRFDGVNSLQRGTDNNDLELSQCRLTVTGKLSENALDKLFLESRPISLVPAKMRMLWDKKVGSDLVVVAANGVEVECHKCILMVSSDVFQAMFESKMKERGEGRLELDDMSEVGVRAFLNFIYTSDLEAATENCDIALELFRAGDKYGISSLQEAMKTLICLKGVEWFNVGVAMRLVILTLPFEKKEEILSEEDDLREDFLSDEEDLSGEEILSEEWRPSEEEIMKNDIMKKVIQVLRWYSKNSPEDLFDSEEYQEVFQSDSKLAIWLEMELEFD